MFDFLALFLRMAKVCEKCPSDFSDAEITVKCNGFCSSEVCLLCAGLTTEICSAMGRNRHLIWVCLACRNLLANARFSNAMVSVNTVNDNLVSSLKTELHDSILAEIRNEIRTNLKELSTGLVPQSGRRETVNAKRRRQDISTPQLAASSSKSLEERPTAPTRVVNKICVVGTCDAMDDLIAVKHVEEDTSLFWLYLSEERVSEERITHLAQTQLNTEVLKVSKLVAKSKDIGSYSFVSFKVGMSLDLRSKALSTETWPAGIKFREWTDYDKSTVKSRERFFGQCSRTTSQSVHNRPQ